MCGIIAYAGNKPAASVVLEGLKKLEYRGYDSWGIVALADNPESAENAGRSFSVIKRVGKIGEINWDYVSEAIRGESHVAVGHTRWSTHGGVTEQNAHPHLDCSGKIAVVHNGIVDNHQEIRSGLGSHKFLSKTDTEVIPHLIEEIMSKESLDFVAAVRRAANTLKGRSAFVAVNSETGQMAAARKGAPLIMGMHENSNEEFFIASDVTAFLDYTNKVMYLDDNEMAVVDGKVAFFNLMSGNELVKRIVEIHWHHGSTEKEGYDHFLIKEIMEQKSTLSRAINQDDAKLLAVANEVKNAFGTFLVGCGTAGKTCVVGEYLFSKIARKHINSVVASEFANYQHYLTPKTLMIAVSQSGETADVLEAIDVAKSKSVRVVSLLNVFGSTMMRVSDDFFMVNAGAERAVVSTKATTAQLAVLTLLAYATAGKLQEGKLLLMNAASAVNDMLNPRYEEHIKKLALQLVDKKDAFIIGRGLNYPIALEAAIKLQETCYTHAQGFAGGELKHGPLALIEDGTACIAIVANDETKQDMISNAAEVKARGGYIIGIAPENNEVFDYWLKVPDVGNASPIVSIIPVQILAYHIAVLRGINPDYPRNLAKVITTK
ncbi:glutamine--fructose-6-phosphate transaminase (isomerizing) [Candidatus Woesearchaeota archaeon]|nr:glutamine--fructose-6-phosphate transaminase (isomerizing) [Candidatus Woesearchaeota archaeon]